MTKGKGKYDNDAYLKAIKWFEERQWTVFPFQEEVWQAGIAGKNGLLNAPTGSGKTYALWFPLLIEWMMQYPKDYENKTNNGLLMLWITPLRALTRDIQKAMQQVAIDLNIPWNIRVRTGDTSENEKQLIRKNLPEVLITTPESLHLMLARKDYPASFKKLKYIVIDEWHELLGSKRGVQVELALSRIRAINSNFKLWAISATIGNLAQAINVLQGVNAQSQETVIVKAEIEKKIKISSILPDEVEKYPWAGHLGLKLIPKLIDIINQSRSTLVFINTRGQTEIWYRAVLEAYPELAGQIALHHGSLDRELRNWVEQAIHDEQLKVVLCTSSLDLGVDFDPVETVVQVGSPKSVARFLQRAGRSGHRPGAESRMYFLPTNSLELLESAALQDAVRLQIIEDRNPLYLPYDVLVQYLITLAVSDGFYGDALFHELKTTFTYQDLEYDDYLQLLEFITTGGESLQQYSEYKKVEREGDFFKVKSRRIAMQHRLSIGTIVSESLMQLKFMHGGYIGSIEENFITRLKTGDVFWFAGRPLELVQIREMTAYVQKSKNKKGIVPSFLGNRLSLSPVLANMLRNKLDDYKKGIIKDVEIEALLPLLEVQAYRSAIPARNELLIEELNTKEGWHYFIYPFSGRTMHEGMAALVAYRIAAREAATFSIAMNDYGFELLTEDRIDIAEAIESGILSTENLHQDLQQSINATEMAKRRFREIAQISGILFTGYPGKTKRNRHLQASSSLFFDVFSQFDSENLLLEQAYYEVYHYLLEEDRLMSVLNSLSSKKVVLTHPKKFTPFAFPIMVDRMRETLTTEKLEDRIKKMRLEVE